jgi:N-acetylmuramoyl-L-alanine amidase
MNLQSVHKSVLKYFASLILLLLPASSIASEKTDVKGIRYWSSPGYTRVVIDLSSPADFSTNRLSDPDRVYFDLKNSRLKKEIKTSLPVGDGLLKAIRAGQFDARTVRVVLDLEKIKDFHSFILDEPTRLVIDVNGVEAAKKPETSVVRRRVVIDPGHGGHDPGAVGPKGLYEKDVVLDIALKLKEILLTDPLNEVFLTRETDRFVSLEERTAMANRKNADFFVSIHANANPVRRVKGIETYLLNWTNDEEAMRVAARENKISLKKMREMHRKMDTLGMILNDLSRDSKRNDSIKLANYIQQSMVTTLNNESSYKRIDLGVKQALFYVLFGARMPSVLVEVSFISNPQEEQLLSDESYRMQIAKAIAKGLNTYTDSAPAIQKVAGL